MTARISVAVLVPECEQLLQFRTDHVHPPSSSLFSSSPPASKMVNIPKYVLLVCAVSHTDPFIQDSPDM
jgi:hypothetical protein